jgi:AcrR family transcriptional regulator
MGVNERKEREKSELRNRILEAATHVFVHEGYEKTSIRSIADKIEYSAGTIYNYFKDKNEILFAIHEDAFEKFFVKMSASLEIQHPVKRLEKMGELYLKFVFENQELYDLMFIDYAPMESIREARETWDCGMKNFAQFRSTVAECIDQGHFKSFTNIELATFMIWTQMHGMASLVIRNRLQMFEEQQVSVLLHSTIQQMIMMYQL